MRGMRGNDLVCGNDLGYGNGLVCGQFEVHVFGFDRKGESFCWAMRGMRCNDLVCGQFEALVFGFDRKGGEFLLSYERDAW